MADPDSPRAISSQGQAAYQRGDFIESAERYKSAADAYQLVGDMLMAAEMHNNASVAYLQAGVPEAALSEVANTPEIFASAGDLRRQAMAIGNRAAALEGLKRVEEALEAYELSAALFEQAGETDLRLHTMQALSALQLESGRRLQALATMKAGLEGINKPTLKQRFLQRLLDIPFNMWTNTKKGKDA
jgi:tetratricopeptide (TPR) repeat protein